VSLSLRIQTHKTNKNCSTYASSLVRSRRAWEDIHLKWGSKTENSGTERKFPNDNSNATNPKISFADLLEPAANYAELGFPVASTTSWSWYKGMPQIRQWKGNGSGNNVDGGGRLPMTCNATGESPNPGEMFVNEDMAQVLREVSESSLFISFSWSGRRPCLDHV